MCNYLCLINLECAVTCASYNLSVQSLAPHLTFSWRVQFSCALTTPLLPKELRMAWELHTQDQAQVPSVKDLIAFLRVRAGVMSETTTPNQHKIKTEPPHRRSNSSHPNKYRAAVHSSASTPVSSPSAYGPRTPFRYECRLCPGNKHPLFQCPALTVKLRGDHLCNNRLCYNCLAPGHGTADCRSTGSCRNCGGRHHTLVHKAPAASPPAQPNQAQPNQAQPQPVVNVLAAAHPSVSSQASPYLTSSLMMTSQVLVKGEGGKQTVARALLDSGASLSLVSNRLAQTLQLPRTATQVQFVGAQATPLQGAQAVAHMTLCPTSNSGPAVEVTAAVVHQVTCDLPLQGATHIKQMPHIRSLALADPTFHLPGKVDLLFGCDIIPEIMLPGHVPGPKHAPMALNTIFGWAVMGIYSPQSTKHVVHTIVPNQSDQYDALLARFWEVEEVPQEQPSLTPEEESVQKHYSDTHKYIARDTIKFRCPEGKGIKP